MSNQPKLNAEQICYRAKGKILKCLEPLIEHCELLIKDEGRRYFVFQFTKWDTNTYVVQEVGRFTVLAAMVEDGTMSEQRLHTALWQELGRIRGVV